LNPSASASFTRLSFHDALTPLVKKGVKKNVPAHTWLTIASIARGLPGLSAPCIRADAKTAHVILKSSGQFHGSFRSQAAKTL